MGDVQKCSTPVDNIAASLSRVFPDGVDERALLFLIKLPQAAGELHLPHGLYVN